MKKNQLSDMTFVIPVRCDSIIRLENTIAVVTFLSRYFQTNIYLLEASAQDNGIINRLLGKKIQYFFLEDHDNIFHKTRYINVLCRKVKTPFMAIWDADVIADPRQILDATEKLRSDEASMAFPYDGRFLDCPEILRSLYLGKDNIKILHDYSDLMSLPYGNELKGGAVFFNTEKFIESGMANEDFYGWGDEDYELYYRFEDLGHKIYRSKGPLYITFHIRGI